MTLTPGRVKDGMVPSPKGYTSLDEMDENIDIHKGLKSIWSDNDLANEGIVDNEHNEDLLNETLREVLKIPSIPIINNPFQVSKQDDNDMDDNKSEDSDGIYENVMDINIDPMKSHDSEALYDEDRVIKQSDNDT
eukprot:CAMPEP_0201578518 /NCGR_PEP_ID=MMETSP0190_2-20130828/25421_1 /ASSEMBLY_ACC=CAM_ASM_000263 /TAXON_ID=37353 /ORGANISM="Rosalina sp." /LENGTH=134 /DNA_ID=CAMNT_0048011785 /DNA_START=247 /DNA_END=648 /DNA_ORIENTATION=+